jgi:hypothetical protein
MGCAVAGSHGMGCAVAGIPGRRRGVQGPPPRVNSGRPVVSARTGMRSGFARPPAFLVLSRARLGQVLPDAALAPVAVAVPQLVGAHVLIARRCKTIQGFETMRASPLILAITGFGLGVKHLNTCTCISACGLRASAYGVRAHMYARTHTGHGNNFGSARRAPRRAFCRFQRQQRQRPFSFRPLSR